RLPRHARAELLVAGGPAVRQAQRSGGVGIRVPAVQREHGFRDLRALERLDALDVVLVPLALVAIGRVGAERERDRGIVGRFDRGAPALEQALALGWVGELAAGQLVRRVLRALAVERGLHPRVGRAQ